MWSCFSGGIGSWAAAKRVAATFGTDDLYLVFADVGGDTCVCTHKAGRHINGRGPCDEKIDGVYCGCTRWERPPHVGEDKDCYRFVKEGAANVGGELVVVKDGRNIWELFHDARFLGNTRVARCSHDLKQKPARRWLEENCDPEDTAVYIGIDWTETHRIPKVEAGYAPWLAFCPMTEPPFLDKADMLAWCRAEGLEPPRMYAAGFPHANCFHGDTRVPTTDGVSTLRALAEGPGEATVITSQGWKWAKASSFGVQPLRPVTFVRSGVPYTVRATPNHRWPVEEYYFSPGSRRNGGNQRLRRTVIKATDELRAGDRIARFPVPCRVEELDADAVACGVVFGDGSECRTKKGNVSSTRVLLCGAKDELASWFPESASRSRLSNGLAIGRLPRDWKGTPDWDADPTLWGSFLAGWFAADGSLTAKSCSLSTCRPESVELAQHAAAVAGVEVTNVLNYERTGFGITGTVWEIGLRLPEHMVLRTAHRTYWKPANFRLQRWTVGEVGPVSDPEEVYCLTVPGPHDFALEYSLGSLNCGGGCVKAGHGQFKLLLESNPERYAYWETQEQNLREYLGKDISVLKDRRGGTTKPLPLSVLRVRLEGEPDSVDEDDLGGCGCFIGE